VSTVDTTTVTLTVNGREITVPKGLSLVEAAAEAGIEVPVFCYEPRLGNAIGACRMCLVEIEGMPKLQTACTTPAADGMIVQSHSDRAREGQDAVLEFLLLNHPLDCPVCDKGGECPLQDLTFRYGPASTRMTLPKRTADKPVAISPLIKLDRERCILCYRCTRFSESVAGDLQLVTENRGAGSIITTFEGRPYDGEFSGNVTELCPVGALTSTTYRFRGRPWEIQQVPTVCGHCPVGCNTYATVREGRVARVLSRNHPDVDEGWLCDKGRYVYTALESESRLAAPMIRGGRGLEEVDPNVVLDHVADRLRATVERFGAGSVAILASGEQTNEEAYLWSRVHEEALGGGPVVCGEEGATGWELVAPYAARIDDLEKAGAIVVAGDVDLVHRAPVLELRIRKAAAAGTRVVTVGAGGTRLETVRGAVHVDAPAGTAHTTLLHAQGDVADALGAEGAVLIWIGRMTGGAASVLAHVAHTTGCSVLMTPSASNELGCQAAGLAGATPEEVLQLAEDGAVKAVILLGADPVGTWPGGERWRAALARCFFVLQISTFQDGSSGWATTLVPAAAALEKEGTITNLEGRIQRLRIAVPPPGGIAEHLVWIAELGSRLGLELPWDAPEAFGQLATTRAGFAGHRWGEIGERAPLPEDRPSRPAQAPPAPRVDEAAPAGGITVVAYRQLHSGPYSENAVALQFQRRIGIEISHHDAVAVGLNVGDPVTVEYDGRSATGPVVTNRRLRPGVVRLPAAIGYVGPGTVRSAEVPAGA